MKRPLTIGISVIGFTLVGSAAASAAPANWVQEVKKEIHQLANPGEASPGGLGE